jgi:hypothetical protein
MIKNINRFDRALLKPRNIFRGVARSIGKSVVIFKQMRKKRENLRNTILDE